MATIIVMPSLGININQCKILKWFVKEGEEVKKDDPLLSVETEKIAMEVPAECSGTLLRVLHREEEFVSTGMPIAVIGEKGEDISDLCPTPEVREAAPISEVNLGSESQEQKGTGEPPEISPLARRIAKEKGLDLTKIRGSGPRGRITKEDVLRFVEQKETSALPSPALQTNMEEEIIPFAGIRKTIADRMVNSVRTAPHYDQIIQADATEMVSVREKMKEGFRETYGLSLTYLPLMIKATARALFEVPIVNATIRESTIMIHKKVHLGVAVAVENGIIVPVIRDVNGKTLLEVTRELAQLTELARTNKLKPDQVVGGTFTITNVGAFGVMFGTTIINQPQVAILGLGPIREAPAVVDGNLAIRHMVYLSASYDHRVVMGAEGGKFLDRLKYHIENPLNCLMGMI
jgi:pyruvate/2-oxoglutarate dehydrogenase complex dihydrolipoamide acyltransferase (E2) component